MNNDECVLIVHPFYLYSGLWNTTTLLAETLTELYNSVYVIYESSLGDMYATLRIENNVTYYPLPTKQWKDFIGKDRDILVFAPFSVYNITDRARFLIDEGYEYNVFPLYEGIVLNPMNNELLENASNIMSCSPFHAHLISNLIKKHVEYIPITSVNPITPSKFSFKERSGIGFIAKYGDRKNINFLISLLAQLPEEIKLYLAVSASKSELKILNYQVKLWNLEDRVLFVTPYRKLRPSEINYLLNGLKLYVSLSGAEGFEIPLLENALAGTPVFKLNIPETTWMRFNKLSIDGWIPTWWGGYFIPKLNKADIEYITSFYYNEDDWSKYSYRLRDEAVKINNEFFNKFISWVERW